MRTGVAWSDLLPLLFRAERSDSRGDTLPSLRGVGVRGGWSDESAGARVLSLGGWRRGLGLGVRHRDAAWGRVLGEMEWGYPLSTARHTHTHALLACSAFSRVEARSGRKSCLRASLPQYTVLYYYYTLLPCCTILILPRLQCNLAARLVEYALVGGAVHVHRRVVREALGLCECGEGRCGGVV